jgi:excisionase family DNA binding protein
MMRKNAGRKPAADRIVDKRGRERAAHNRKPSERGLSTAGGGWNINQAAEWSGIGSGTLRKMAEAGQVPCVKLGRRFLIPRQGFIDWFNAQRTTTAA